MTGFDLLLRGGNVVDGTGGPRRCADVGVPGDRILAVGDLAAVAAAEVATVLELDGRVVAPGFIDPHGHSDGSLFLDGALASHLHQGYTTQLSGNCGDTLAPITPAGRETVELSLRPTASCGSLGDVRGVPGSGLGAAARPECRVPRRSRGRSVPP